MTASEVYAELAEKWLNKGTELGTTIGHRTLYSDVALVYAVLALAEAIGEKRDA